MRSFNVKAVVEIPMGSLYKYEFDKKTKTLVIDRPLPSPLTYNYGYVPYTLHGDGDPTDICIIGDSPIYPLTNLSVLVIGAFKCIDNGCSDDKLVGVVLGDKMPEYKIKLGKNKIKHYLSVYKEGFFVKEFVYADEAYEILTNDLNRFGEH